MKKFNYTAAQREAMKVLRKRRTLDMKDLRNFNIRRDVMDRLVEKGVLQIVSKSDGGFRYVLFVP